MLLIWRLAFLLLFAHAWAWTRGEVKSEAGTEVGGEGRFGKLVFRSGFEEGVRIVPHPYFTQNHTLLGSDGKLGDWKTLRQSLSQLRFAYVIGGKQELRDTLVRTKLMPEQGRKGSRALLMEVLDDFPGDEFHTRSELSLFPKEEEGALFSKQGFARYWMKYDEELLQERWPMEWINFFEVKEKRRSERENYRFNFRVMKSDHQKKPYWGLVVHNYFEEEYEVVRFNKEVPVPVGEWFLVEGFWRRDEKEGRLWLRINQEVVFDFRGRTQHPSHPLPVRFWSPLKNYRHRAWHEGEKSVRVWYDDLELWSGLPEGLSLKGQEN